MTAVFAVVALVLGLARLAMFIGLHVHASDYDPVRHAVSNYAVGRTRPLSSAMTWATGGMWLALAVAVGLGFPQWSDRTGVIACLAVLALLFAALPLLPTDLEGERPTRIGRLHLLAAIAWFALSYACMGNFARLLQEPPAIGATLVVLSWVTLVSLILLIAALLIKPLRRRLFGLFERAFLVAVNLFYITVSAGILLQPALG